MSIFGNIVHGIDNFANKINPMKQPMQWLTDNTIGKIPGNVGRLGSQTYDYSNSHALESLGAMAAIYGGAAYLGAGAAGGAGGAGAAGAAEGAGGGLAAGGGLGTASGFGGVGVDAGATGFGGWGTAAGGADVGGLASLDSAAVGAEGASPGLMGSYGPASSSGFDWQGLARQALSNGLKNQSGSSGGQYQPMQSNQDQGGQQQKMASALMQPDLGGSPYLPSSQIGNAALAAYLMPQSNSQQLYQPGAVPTHKNANRNPDGTIPMGSNY